MSKNARRLQFLHPSPVVPILEISGSARPLSSIGMFRPGHAPPPFIPHTRASAWYCLTASRSVSVSHNPRRHIATGSPMSPNIHPYMRLSFLIFHFSLLIFNFSFLILHSAQRRASHSLRLTKPFKTFFLAYTHLLNSACISSVGAPAFIFLSRVESLNAPSPRL